MIVREVTIHGNIEFYKTYSDNGMKVERDGIMYDLAVDPINSGRTYIETNIPANGSMFGELSDADALNIIMGVSE